MDELTFVKETGNKYMQEDRDMGAPTPVTRARCIEGSKGHAGDAMPPTLSREWNLPSRLHIVRGDGNRSIQSKRQGESHEEVGRWFGRAEVGDKRSKKDVWIRE